MEYLSWDEEGSFLLPKNPHQATENILSEQILPFLAPSIRTIISRAPLTVRLSAEEIRLREEKPLQIYTHANDSYLDPQGNPVAHETKAYLVSNEDIAQTIRLLTRSSLYALEEELRRGYLTIAGGHRVGLAGRAVLSPEGAIQSMKHISYLNIRIARDVQGVADSIKPFLVNPASYQLHNTLIISPPQCGKTTLLRDLARQISNGQLHPRIPGLKVGIVDERSELAGSVNGVPQHAVGSRTDVLDACPKAEGMFMMIRSMSPQVLITDEIGREEDREAILEAIHAGVRIITSAHGFSLTEVKNRPAIGALFEQKAFARYLILSRKNGPVTLEAVYDKDGTCLFQRGDEAECSK